MFCKHCGKNIYDLEKCPFCNDGEKLDGQANKETVATEEPNTTEAANESAVAAQSTPNVEKKDENTVEPEKKEDNSKASDSHIPTEKDVSFNDKIKKESKPYKALNTLDGVILGLQFGLPVLFLLFSWIQNKGSLFGYVLFNAVDKVLEYEALLAFLGFVIGLVQMIIFIVLMNKKKPSNRELFRSMGFGNQESDYAKGVSGMGFQPVQGISFKYSRSAFVISIIEDVLELLEKILFIFVFNAAMPTFISASSQYPLFTNAFTNAVNWKGILMFLFICWLAQSIVFRLTAFILKSVKTSKQKKMTRMFINGELENANQENKTEQ